MYLHNNKHEVLLKCFVGKPFHCNSNAHHHLAESFCDTLEVHNNSVVLPTRYSTNIIRKKTFISNISFFKHGLICTYYLTYNSFVC